mgnify:CR=1 FL=1
MSEHEHNQSSEPQSGRAKPGKYMTFKLAGEEYGLEILKVRELIRLLEITRVPQTKPFIRGVINLRGRVIPVVDLRLKFGMSRLQETDHTVIIVVQFESAEHTVVMGILVDEVLEVVDVEASQLTQAPEFSGGGVEMGFLLGIAQFEQRVILLLDISRVLTSEETIQLNASVKSGPDQP